MAMLKKLFQGESKSDYTERIPDSLVPQQFELHQTFQHGFPHQPSCLAYDCVQSLLAVGSLSGTISLIGKAGLECHFCHSSGVGVLQLLFLDNRGYLASRCSDNSLYLWSLRGKTPQIIHKLDFQRDNISHISCPFKSDWLYVGMEGGNVHIVNVNDFTLSGYSIYWDKFVESGIKKTRPGDVLAILEHPNDNSKILVSFTGGLSVLWNIRSNCVEKRFSYQTSSITVLMSVSWHGNGKQFACAYSNGNIVIFNVKYDDKPERVIAPHGSLSNNSPILQLQWVYTEADSWFIFSGGYGDKSDNSITLQTTQNISLKSFEQPIIQFFCLPSTPFVTDCQKTFALAVLTQSELVMFDLQTPGLPNYFIPFSFDVHLSPVTSVEYYGNCPDDFIALLHSVKSKLPHQQNSTKAWPLKGGKWGQESPDPWTDLIITGHLDGSIRLWFCRSVIMQPLFTISACCYFKQLSATPTSQTQLTTPSPVTPLPKIEETDESKKEESAKTPSSEATPSTLTVTPPATPTTPDLLSPENERKLVHSKHKKSVFNKAKKGAMKKLKKLKKADDAKPSGESAIEVDDEEEEIDDNEGSTVDTTDAITPKDKPSTLPLSTPPSPGIFIRNVSTESNDYVIVSLNNRNYGSKCDSMAIHKLSFSSYTQSLCVATPTGHCLTFEFSLQPISRKPQSLMIDLSNDSVIIHDSSAEFKRQLSLSFDTDMEQELPGFHVIQHCYCHYGNNNVDITAMKYWPINGLLFIGSDFGLVIVNTLLNQTLKILGTLTSILYLADPSSYSKLVKKLTQETIQLQKGSTCPDLISKQHLALSQKRQSSPLIIPSIELPHIDSSTNSPAPMGKNSFRKKISQQSDDVIPVEHLVTCIEIVQMFIHKTQPPAMTIWIGTYSGQIAVYSVRTVKLSQGKTSTELLPTGLVFDKKSPIVNLHFLSEWGEQLITPYKPYLEDAENSPELVSVLRRQKTAKELPNCEKLANYVVMVTAESIQCVGFPGNHMIGHVDSIDEQHIVHSGFFTCDGLPCLLTLYSHTLITVHTLPGLKPMLQYQYEPLADPSCLYTFRISGDGQALYLRSPSQFQRVSITKHDNLNVPLSLPELHLLVPDPVPASKGVLNDLLSGLTTPTVVSRDKMFGIEAAGKAWKSIAKIDETYEKTAKKEGGAAGGGRKGRGGGASNTGGGADNAFTKARQKLDERNEQLSEIEEATRRLQDDATDFASVAAKLAAKYKKK